MPLPPWSRIHSTVRTPRESLPGALQHVRRRRPPTGITSRITTTIAMPRRIHLDRFERRGRAATSTAACSRCAARAARGGSAGGRRVAAVGLRPGTSRGRATRATGRQPLPLRSSKSSLPRGSGVPVRTRRGARTAGARPPRVPTGGRARIPPDRPALDCERSLASREISASGGGCHARPDTHCAEEASGGRGSRRSRQRIVALTAARGRARPVPRDRATRAGHPVGDHPGGEVVEHQRPRPPPRCRRRS